MFSKIKKNIFYIFITIIINSMVSYVYAQSEDTTFSVSGYFNIGYATFISELDYKKLNKNGFNGTIRIMWEPDNLLSVGLESGYLWLYKLDEQSFKASSDIYTITSKLATVPVLAVFSMRIFNKFKVSVGSGLFFLMSNVDALGNPVRSTQLSTGSFGAASYLIPLSEIFSLGAEIKYYYFNKIENGDLTIQMSFHYKFLIY